MRPVLLLALAAATAVAAPTAAAQPRADAAPQFGTHALADGPVAVAIQAGGADRNAVPGSGCSGFIRNAAPAARIESGAGALSIWVTSSTDTTLLVADPSGRWHCSDDANGSNPAVTFARAASGTYTVWVGTFSPEAAGADATLSAAVGQPRW